MPPNVRDVEHQEDTVRTDGVPMVEGVSCGDCAENCSFGGGWEATAPIAGISPEVAMERRVGGLGAGDGCFGLESSKQMNEKERLCTYLNGAVL